MLDPKTTSTRRAAMPPSRRTCHPAREPTGMPETVRSLEQLGRAPVLLRIPGERSQAFATAAPASPALVREVEALRQSEGAPRPMRCLIATPD